MVLSSKADNAIESLIWCIVDLPMNDGRILTSRMDASTKSAILRVLSEWHLDEPARTDVTNVLNTLQDRQADRNFIAHGTWGTLKRRNVATALSLRPKSAPGEVIAEIFPEERFDQIKRDMDAAIKTLARVEDVLAPSRQRWSGRRPQGRPSHPPAQAKQTPRSRDGRPLSSRE
jgi:hypothetical protein